MVNDAIANALDAAIKAVRVSLPSQAPAVAVRGERKTADGGVRIVKFTMPSVLLETTAMQLEGVDSPTIERQLTAYITRADWHDDTDPQIGDWMLAKLPKDAAQSWCRVAVVTHMVSGDYRLTLIFDPKRTPPWST